MNAEWLARVQADSQYMVTRYEAMLQAFEKSDEYDASTASLVAAVLVLADCVMDAVRER